MKQLKFEHHSIKDIQRGLKIATIRINDDKDIHIGDVIQCIDKVYRDKPTTWQMPGELKITSIEETFLEQLTEEHMARAESFGTLDEMITTFKRFYGEHISKMSPVRILYFTYTPYDKPLMYLDYRPEVPMVDLEYAKLFTDGGSRGNPGPSSLGFVVLDTKDRVAHSDNKYLGITTNNQAEYHALLAGLEWCLKHNIQVLEVYMDSMLVVSQLSGKFKVKNRDLWTLYQSSMNIAKKFRKISFTHIPRELNKLADKEVNKALDAIKGSDIVQ